MTCSGPAQVLEGRPEVLFLDLQFGEQVDGAGEVRVDLEYAARVGLDVAAAVELPGEGHAEQGRRIGLVDGQAFTEDGERFRGVVLVEEQVPEVRQRFGRDLAGLRVGGVQEDLLGVLDVSATPGRDRGGTQCPASPHPA